MLKRLLDLLLYGHFWIAACAMAMAYQTKLLLLDYKNPTELEGFIFCGTFALYALHRVIGLGKVGEHRHEGRFAIIHYYRKHIVVYSVVAALIGLYLFFQLRIWTQIAVVASGIVSLGYILPVFPGEKRLRDFPFFKIFLVAFTWAWVTVFLPAVEYGYWQSSITRIQFLERMFFIFALAIPFDIRDQHIDKDMGAATLVNFLGTQKSLLLAYICLALFGAAALANMVWGNYEWRTFLALVGSGLIGFLLVRKSPEVKNDYYFTAGVDGLMLVQTLWVMLTFL